MSKFNLKEKAQLWDATYVFPRPANEQYLSSYRLLMRISKDGSVIAFSCGLSVVSSILATYTLYYALNTFSLTFTEGLGLLLTLLSGVLLIFVWAMFLLDVSGVYLPYKSVFQRESHGGRYWAGVKDLEKEDVNAIRRQGENTVGKGVILAPFKHFVSAIGNSEPKYNIFLTLQRMTQAMIIFGPPGSGKSSTFFIPVVRQFADCGGAIVLDVKGEIFNYTAHYYSNVFRIDIENPYNSDWFDLFGSCYRNPDLANRIASYMVGLDANAASGKDPFWDQSAISMLTVMILFLCEKTPNPTPRDILRFLAENEKESRRPKLDAEGKPERDDKGNIKTEKYSPLNEAFAKCPYPYVHDLWGATFADMPEDTFGSIKGNADNAIKQLLSPKVTEILRPPTAGERAKGRRRINFTHLRKMFEQPGTDGVKRGTAVYIVVSPSDAMNMDAFLRVIFSVALDTLRESAKEGANVLVALDEAGNVPLSKLPEGINTDRSKGICYFLGYQDKNQPIAQYGKDKAATFLGTAGVNIFLPGVDDDTAKMASDRIGETTILQRSSSDAKNNGLDSEKVSEAGRKLILPQDLTEMKWFTQCVITIKGAAPIRTKIPNDAKMQDTRITMPQRIIDNVSEEVLRLLGHKKGRDSDQVLLPPRIDQNEPAAVRVPETNDNNQATEKPTKNPVSVIPAGEKISADSIIDIKPTVVPTVENAPIVNTAPPAAIIQKSASPVVKQPSSMEILDGNSDEPRITKSSTDEFPDDAYVPLDDDLPVPFTESADVDLYDALDQSAEPIEITPEPSVDEPAVVPVPAQPANVPSGRRRIVMKGQEVVNESYSDTRRVNLEVVREN